MPLVIREIHCREKSWTFQSISNHLFTLKVFLKPVTKQENSSWVHQDIASAKTELTAWTLPELSLLSEKLYFWWRQLNYPLLRSTVLCLAMSQGFSRVVIFHIQVSYNVFAVTLIVMRHTEIAVLGILTDLSIKWSIIKHLTGFPSVSASVLY